MKKNLTIILRDKHYWKKLLNLYWEWLKNACVLILVSCYLYARPPLWQIMIVFVIVGIILFLSSLAIRIYLSQREDLNSDEKKE